LRSENLKFPTNVTTAELLSGVPARVEARCLLLAKEALSSLLFAVCPEKEYGRNREMNTILSGSRFKTLKKGGSKWIKKEK
jgi:hypothetical protein